MRSSRRFPESWEERAVVPVTLPPGRARLATNPARTGSAGRAPKTIGIVAVACLAARACPGPETRMRSTGIFTSSTAPARAGARAFPTRSGAR